MSGTVPILTTADGTVAQALDAAAARLRDAGVDGARRDALLLLAAALNEELAAVRARPEWVLDGSAQARFDSYVDRRAGREPVSRILGTREFWSLPFAISADTLDPRPDSETLVAAVLTHIGDRTAPLTILDLGTGSGCLLLALLSELPAARGLGIDVSKAAVGVARRNAVDLGLAGRSAFLCAPWGAALAGAWQVIVSNPPYIVSRDIPHLAPEVRLFDPPLALAGGADGLDAYRDLAPDIARLLAPGGVAALEIEPAQIENVEGVLQAAGLRGLGRARDLAGHWRCILAEGPEIPAEWRK
jgi:release factor glutamine methyltransferase